MAVLIETSLGDITVDLFTEERPRSSLNFLKLCKMKYYNFCLFHSVQRNLVAQTGDPTGTGRGGQSIFVHIYGDQAAYFDMENVPRMKHRKKGLISMVNNGSNGHGSQFFFTLGEDLDYLDGVHTVIGEVAEGFDVLDKINEAYCDEEHRPYKDIRIYHTIILDDPYSDPEGLAFPDKSPEPTKEQLDSGRIGADEDIDDSKGMTEVEEQEALEKKEAQANAQILEMVGDLPDADVKPPDTVLFVCKLNPVTTSEDLEIIFSRFGKISSCEVIKDQTSGESLQYAFIEFEKPDDCESAYFKMDNVLIDDRRIHVDFSQSVSKIQFDGGKGNKVQEVFGSKFSLKDNSRKDNKYDLVFEEKGHDEDKSRKKESKKSRKRSKSRSPNRLAVERRKRQDSGGPVEKQRDDGDSAYKKTQRKDRTDDELDRRRDRKYRDRDGSTERNPSRQRNYSDSEPENDVRKRDIKSERSNYSDRDSGKRSYKYSKYKEERRRSPSASSDESSPERKGKKKKSRKSESQSDDSSDERSKFNRRSNESRKEKSKYRDHRSDSDNGYTSKKKKIKKTSRDDRYDVDSKYSKHRDSEDRKYQRDRDRSKYDHYSDRDRSEKRYRDKR